MSCSGNIRNRSFLRTLEGFQESLNLGLWVGFLASSTTSRPTDTSLQALLSFVAVTQSQHGDDILGQVLLQCLVMSLGKPLASAEDFSSTLRSLFGLDIGLERVQNGLDKLVAQGQITRPMGSAAYSVNAALGQRIEVRIESAKNLESSVREK